jgi:ribosome-associated protein
MAGFSSDDTKVGGTRKERIMEGVKTNVDPSVEALVAVAFRAAQSKQAIRPIALNVQGLTSLADFFLIFSGSSERQVKTIAQAIQEALKEDDITLAHGEGFEAGHWILLDYGDVVIHIFYEETREFYKLEKLWIEAEEFMPNGALGQDES